MSPPAKDCQTFLKFSLLKCSLVAIDAFVPGSLPDVTPDKKPVMYNALGDLTNLVSGIFPVQYFSLVCVFAVGRQANAPVIFLFIFIHVFSN